MSTPVPPTGAAPVQTAGATQAAASPGTIAAEVLTDLPPALARSLQAGATLAGTLSARPQTNQIVIQTPEGALPVQTGTTLPPGTAVLLRVAALGPPLQVTVQPQAPAQAAPGQVPGGTAAGQGAQRTLIAAQLGSTTGSAAASGQGTAAGAQAGQAAVVTTLTQGSVLTATVSGAGFTPPSGLQSALQAAATAKSGPAAAAAKAAGGIAKAAASAAGTGQQHGSAATAAGSGLQATRPLPVGTTLPLRILSVAQPGQTLPSPPAGTLTLTATVSGATPDGRAIVQTAGGQLTLATNGAPPPGTQLLLEVAGQPRQATRAGKPATSGTAQRFEALREAIAVLQQGDAAGAQRLTQSLVPQPGPQLGAALAFLILALRGNLAERWLGGDMVRTLERLRPGSGSRLGSELGSLTGRASDSGGQEWRSYQLPVLNEGDFEPLRLYIRDRPEGGGRERDESGEQPGQRFVVEANFTRLGPFQFDGKVNEKHIDLMIRTHAPLPDDMRREIHDLFADTVSAMGYTGIVGFHVVREFDIKPVAEPSLGRGGTTA